jgi:hypothetical protein
MPKKGFRHSEESKKKMSDGHLKNSKTLESRIKRSDAMKKYFAETPGALDQNRKRNKERFSDPKIRELHSRLQKQTHNNPITKKKMSKSQKDFWDNHPEHKERLKEIHIGMKASEQTKKKMSKKKLGINNNNWKGGISTLYHNIRDSSRYNDWRIAIFERDNFCDWFSGVKGNGNLNAHHIEPFSTLLERYDIQTFEQAMVCEALWNVDNGVTMIDTNHSAYHSMWG